MVRIGLDLGSNSLGCCALECDAQGQPSGVRLLGVRIFSDGRNPKDGTSLAIQRRLPRGMRTRRDRYLSRRTALLNALVMFDSLPADAAERHALSALNPYAVRSQAAYRPMKPYELGRAIFHLDQRRGFKSNRKADTTDEDSAIQPRIDELRRRMGESGAKTLGDYLYRRQQKGKMIRARPEAGIYPDRQLYQDEFDVIRAVQESHQTLRPEQWDALREIIFFQRPLKPVEPGWCLLEDGERRAHRALPCAQEFRMVQEVNNLGLKVAGKPRIPLSAAQRRAVLTELRERKEVKLDSLQKKLIKQMGLDSSATLNLLDENRTVLKGDETAARLSLKHIFGKRWFSRTEMPLARRTEIVRALIEAESSDAIIQRAQAEWGLDEAAARKLAATPMPPGYASLSEVAIGKVLPLMEDQGLTWSAAAAAVPEYGHHSDFRPDAAMDRLPYYGAVLPRQVVGADPTRPATDEVARYGRIANPTVHIGLNQLRRVANHLVKTYGRPEEIVVELARDLKMSKEDKDEDRRKNRENEAANRRREEQIRAARDEPTPDRLRKLRLWEEQRFGAIHVCPFTGEPISFEMALSNVTEVEHILPFSKTLDDSMANKVVCLAKANRAKRDRSPYDAFHTDPTIGGQRYEYEGILLRADGLPSNKRWRFYPDAMERFTADSGFLDRQLNETKYLSRIARGYLAHLYDEKAEGRLRVRAIPGKLTAMLRGKWGLNSLLGDHNRTGGEPVERRGRKNRDDHRHHAIDAFVIAMTDQRLLQQIAALNSDADRARLIDQVPLPWEGFTPDVLRPHLDRLVVSHKRDHGTFPWMAKAGSRAQTSGALHNDTAYGLIAPSKNGTWQVVSRTALASLITPEKLEAGLGAVRDKALQDALLAEWQAIKLGRADHVALSKENGGRKKNPAAVFADHVANHGVMLGGRRVKVRRVRMTDEMAVIPIKDRRTGKPYKAYKPDGNAFAEIYRLPNGRWTAVPVTRFAANQPDFDPAAHRPHPAAKKLMRLHIDDMVAVDEAGRRRVLRIVKMSGQTITMADHYEAGSLKARDADKADRFKYFSKSAGALKAVGFRKVGVDEIGRLTDPGPPRSDPA